MIDVKAMLAWQQAEAAMAAARHAEQMAVAKENADLARRGINVSRVAAVAAIASILAAIAIAIWQALRN